MNRSIIAVLVMVALGVTSSAWAAQNVERSGSVYHIPVCPGPAAPGTARCHAHVVTDSNGVPLENQDTHANPLGLNAKPDRGGGGPPPSVVSPAGYWPTDLRSAYGLPSTDTDVGTMTIAIVDAYGYPNALKDLNTYRTQFGLGALPACPSTASTGCFAKYNQNGQQSNYPRYNNG